MYFEIKKICYMICKSVTLYASCGIWKKLFWDDSEKNSFASDIMIQYSC